MNKLVTYLGGYVNRAEDREKNAQEFFVIATTITRHCDENLDLDFTFKV